MYVTTGNAFDASTVWGGSEAVVRLPLTLADPTANDADFFTPTNWHTLDEEDLDLGALPNASTRSMVGSEPEWRKSRTVAEAPGLAPPAAPVAEASAALSPDQEELKALSAHLADVRQRVDEIAAQLAAGQEQVTRDINNKLQEVEQDILAKVSAPPPRPAAAPARKSVPLPRLAQPAH
jgi:hypothetical protein